MNDLWKNVDFTKLGERPNLDARSLSFSALMKSVLSKKEGHISELTEEGHVALDESDNEPGFKFIEIIKKKGGRLVYKSLDDNSFDCLFIWDDGMVELSGHNTYLSVNGLSHSEKLLNEISKELESLWVSPKPEGQIYAIMRHGMNLTLSIIGNAGIPLEDNYTDKVTEDYRYVIKELRSSAPDGRITIMTGKPGTGKTHLVRAMLLEVPDAMFVLVSPEMVKTLAGPELLPLLINYRGALTGPIVLVLEDADLCLVTREANNINSIQSLLNLGDGILGSLLDLRIVATTNASNLEMDPAVTRPGRLCRKIEVGPLDVPTALKIFSRLLPEAAIPVELAAVKTRTGDAVELSLAEVYSLARKYGWAPKQREVKDNSDDEDDMFD